MITGHTTVEFCRTVDKLVADEGRQNQLTYNLVLSIAAIDASVFVCSTKSFGVHH
jgi:hypothetical protein